MQHTRRRTRRLTALSAAAALGSAAVLVPPAAAAEPTPIADVQGDGDATPLDGDTVTVEGVVTADHRTGGYSGFYVQTPGSGGTDDATPGRSDGVFVYLGSRTADLAVGDLVQVTGTAAEYFGLTQVNASGSGASVEVLGEGELPEPVALPDTLLGDDREQYEGMLVAPEGDYLVASMHEVDQFGALWLSAGDTLPVKSTAVARPGAEADAIAAENAARRLLLDDGRSNRVTGATQPYLTADEVVRVGDGVDFDGLAYVLHYGFDEWRLQPTTPLSADTPDDLEPTFVPLNPRPEQPADVGGDLQVGAFNVLNYFTTFTEDDDEARGARNQAQFDVQKPKIVAAIRALGAEVVALQEIENSVHFGDGTPDVALADLVEALNAAEGADVWSFVATPEVLVGDDAPATDVIMNAIVYRSDAVEPVGESRADVDEDVWDIAREPIAQTFRVLDAPGSEFTVVANHFKSKGGDGPDPADGQGHFNAERVEQAQALADFVAELEAETGVADAVVLGDLNSYPQEDPVQALRDAGFVDVVAEHAPGQHTYTFDGEQGSLDHALGTPSFAERVTGADVWDVNADEWFGRQYYGAFPEEGTVYRASDHDPVLVGLTAEPEAVGTVEIDLLGINDFHGRLEADGAVAGAAVLAGAVDQFRAENENTLFVSGGDNIGASTFTSFVQQDVPTIEALNAMGLDVSAVGNHELDQGREDLDDRVLGLVDFPYLAANLYDEATGEPAYDEYWVTETGGVSVGFVGAVTESLDSLVSPSGIATLDIRPIVPEVNRVAAQLTDGDDANGEADVVVLLVHEGPPSGDPATWTEGTTFGDLVAGLDDEVDAVVAGHTHEVFAELVPVDGWADGVARPVVQSGEYGENLAHVTLEVDVESGEVVGTAAEIVPLTDEDEEPLFPSDPEVEQIVADAVDAAEELGAEPLGEITADFSRAVQSDGSDNRGGESRLGNLVADVQLWATQDLGTEIAFMNPGGLRADLLYAASGEGDTDGVVTYREAATVQPFANTLVALTLTGEQVVQVLEEQWQPAGESRPFLRLGVAGITYTYDPEAPAGERILDVRVGDEPLDPEGEYRVVANSFLASGGDNFATLAEGADAQDTGRVDLQAFVDYLDVHSPVSPDETQRAVGVHVVEPPADGFEPGAEVTVRLSSLLFSTAQPEDPEVAVSVDGEVLATAPIDPTIVDTTDEVGRAEVTFTVPDGAEAGELTVTATVHPTGTTASFTVQVADVDEPEEPEEPEEPDEGWLIALLKKLFGWLWWVFFGWWQP